VDISLLPANITIVSNLNGLAGGIALWRDAVPLVKRRPINKDEGSQRERPGKG
jgi:hypothetical protein